MYTILVFIVILIGIYIVSVLMFADKPGDKDAQAVKDAFKRVVQRHMLSVSDMSRFGSRLIAMDADLAKLVLIVYKNGVSWEKYINLEDILFCRINKTENKANGHIQTVSMELTFRDNRDNVSFPFFDEKLDGPRELSYRIRKSNYWKRKIQMHLSMRETNGIRQRDPDEAMA